MNLVVIFRATEEEDMRFRLVTHIHLPSRGLSNPNPSPNFFGTDARRNESDKGFWNNDMSELPFIIRISGTIMDLLFVHLNGFPLLFGGVSLLVILLAHCLGFDV